MSKAVKGLLVLLLILAFGGAYWLGRVHGGRTGPGRSAAGNLVQNITIETDQKDEAGAIYGDFTVVVQVKNTTSQTIRQVKVVCQQLRTDARDLLAVPAIETKLLTVAEIKPGSEHTLRFSGFKAQKPEERQEILVNVVGYSGLGKLPYKAIAKPGDQV